MTDTLLLRIRQQAVSQGSDTLPRPVTEATLRQTEVELGFPLPPLLRQCYLSVGDGGFGPGYGVTGLADGSDGDFGTLVEAYQTMRDGYRRWPPQLLPFCEWGGNLLSCVDCLAAPYPVYWFEEGELAPGMPGLTEFLECWASGNGYSRSELVEVEEIDVPNPFGGGTTTIRSSRHRPGRWTSLS